MTTLTGLTRPEAQPITLSPSSSAVLALDMAIECEHADAPAYPILKPVAAFLERARRHGVPIVYTVSFSIKGTPVGEVAPTLRRAQNEPVIYPNGFDKFTGGELDQLLRSWGVESLVFVGWATNIAVMYTATAAARVYRYQAVIPLDGVVAQQPVEHEYALHQLATLPPKVIVPVQFSALDQITFQ